MSFEFRPQSVAPSPISSDNFQRAVFKAAPKRFTIEFLPPTKLGSTYHHGMRISSISKGDRSSRGSMSSADSVSQYDIWRRWEDCLWLQDTLESEYRRSARERRVRLAQGKGVKTFNGMYKQDMASSWESLPPGPEPTSVATDIHSYIPHLTKKGTFFRPKPGTIERRQQEFQALVEALMSDSMPALVKEIRASRIITDYFGYWRRDIEFEEKLRKRNPQLANVPRSSITSNVFSTYFSDPASSQASLSTPTRPSKRPRPSSTFKHSEPPESFASVVSSSPSITASCSSRANIGGDETLRKAVIERELRRLSSSSESSTQSEEAVSDRSYTTNSSAPKIAEDSPVKSNYNPHRGAEPPSPILEEPRDDTSIKPPLEMGHAIHIHRRSKSEASGDRRSNRSCQVFSTPIKKHEEDIIEAEEEEEECPPVRESWQTAGSADTYLQGLEFQFPGSPKDERASMQSYTTLRTIDSGEGVIPHSPRSSGESDYKLHMPRASVPVSLSDFDIFSESEGKMSLLNSYPRPLSYLPEESDSRPQTPSADIDIRTPPRRMAQALPNLMIPPNTSYFSTPSPIPSPSPPLLPEQEQGIPGSPRTSTYSNTLSISTSASEASAVTPTSAWMQTPSSTTSSHKGGSITLKITLGSSIIMLKVSREISYPDLRQRIYNKFVGQEGIPLSRSFDIIQRSPVDDGFSKSIDSDLEWKELCGTFEGSKLLLRVVDSS